MLVTTVSFPDVIVGYVGAAVEAAEPGDVFFAHVAQIRIDGFLYFLHLLLVVAVMGPSSSL